MNLPFSANAQLPRSSAALTRIEALFFIAVPLSLLVLLFLVPPHAFDMSVNRLFFAGDGWPWHDSKLFLTLTHTAPKIFTGLVAAAVIVILAAGIARGRRIHEDPLLARCLYVLAAMSAGGVLVWLLKGTTGVSCPWDLQAFGGPDQLSDPSLSFSFRHGKCWPAGHAGAGFMLFAFYFALRGVRPRLARAAFWFAAAFGLFCGFTRVMQGAHFPSHVIATGLIDWLVCALLFVLFTRLFPVIRECAPEARGKAAAAAPAPAPRFGMAALIAFTAFWWTLVFDAPFFRDFIGFADPSFVWSWRSAAAGAAIFGAFFAAGMALCSVIALLPRAAFRLLLAALAVIGALCLAGSLMYGMIFTPDMARNFIATDVHEVTAYISVRTVLFVVFAALPPIAAAFLADLRPAAGARFVPLKKAGAGIALLACAVALIGVNFQSFSSIIRHQKHLRYEIAPVNAVYSTASALLRDPASSVLRAKTNIDPAPRLAVSVKRPVVFVVAIGETMRSANWGLSGYARDTSPELRSLNVINFPRVESCGTSTDVSLPCMMSRIGRENYDRERILSEESLPDVLQRAGMNVLWIDNQSGCKGTSEGVETRKPEADPALCKGGVCYDGIFVNELKKAIANLPADRPTVLFYHMYGQHGPAYTRGSPDAMKVWKPECLEADLGACTKEQIRNAYDNGVHYTDHVLASLIDVLKANEDRVDGALLFVSDHGESLGEKGLFLHGAPHFAAPDEQTRVPMVMWLSKGWDAAFGDKSDALRRAAAKGGATHENLFSTVLGMLGVQSSAKRDAYDLTLTK
jgi:lipid A ethanolaminephosphotransferase